MAERLFGRNAVRECLRARRRHIHRLLLAQGIKQTPAVQESIRLAEKLHVPIETIPRQKLNKLGSGNQGIALEVGRFPTFDLSDLILYAQKQPDPPFLLALDHIEDPHNVGALLRTAEAVGVHGIIIPNRRAAGITPAVVNTSAGAAEHHRVAIVPNLAQTLNTLKRENMWVVGVEKSARAQPYHQTDLTMPLVLVLGNEGKGLSHRIEQIFDLLISLPMRGKIESLNASVAGALALYEVWRSRKFLSA